MDYFLVYLGVLLSQPSQHPGRHHEGLRVPPLQLYWNGTQPESGPFCYICDKPRRELGSAGGCEEVTFHICCRSQEGHVVCHSCVASLAWSSVYIVAWCGPPPD